MADSTVQQSQNNNQQEIASARDYLTKVIDYIPASVMPLQSDTNFPSAVRDVAMGLRSLCENSQDGAIFFIGKAIALANDTFNDSQITSFNSQVDGLIAQLPNALQEKALELIAGNQSLQIKKVQAVENPLATASMKS